MHAHTRTTLTHLIAGRSALHTGPCVKLTATHYVPRAAWDELQDHQRYFLHCIAAGAAAHKAVLVGRSAAAVSGMWVLTPPGCDVELAMPSGNPPSKSQWPQGVIYRYNPVPAPMVRELGAHSVRCTENGRTAIDIARYHGIRDGVVAMDSFYPGLSADDKMLVERALARELENTAGLKRIADARAAFALSSQLSESPMETLLRVILAEQGITVEEQRWIGPHRVDLLWGNLVIEVDGDAKYGPDPAQAAIKQLERENWIREQGYNVVRIRPARLLRDEASCLTRILSAKRVADALGPVRVPATAVRMEIPGYRP